MFYLIDYEGTIQFSRPLTEMEVTKWMQEANELHDRLLYPDFYLHWVPTSDRTGLEWDGGGGGSFAAEDWLIWVFENYLVPWDIVANGEIYWQGEEPYDFGILKVKNNAIEVWEGIEDYILLNSYLVVNNKYRREMPNTEISKEDKGENYVEYWYAI